MSWFFSNSSIRGEKVSKGRPRRCSSGDPVTANVQVFKTLGSLDRPSYHRPHILPFGTADSAVACVALAAGLIPAATMCSLPPSRHIERPLVDPHLSGRGWRRESGRFSLGNVEPPQAAVERRDGGGTRMVPLRHV